VKQKQEYPIRIDEKVTGEIPIPDGGVSVKPPKSNKVKLTNKAGAFANPLAKDVDAWLKIGWYRV
jgi:hypothetical protein